MPSILRFAFYCPLYLCMSASLAIAQSAPAAAPAKAGPDTVVARQGAAVVTMADIDAFAQKIDEKQRPGFFDSPKRLDSLITNLLLERQLAAEARQMGLEKDPMVQKQLQIADEEVLGGARMRVLRDDIKLPDFNKLAREEYLAHKEKYVNPGQLDVKHILISTDQHSDADAKALADDVRKQAIAHPDQFDALIDKYSEDPSKDKNHGLMQQASDNKKYVAPFANAANALKVPGEISAPVKTKFGYHILKLVARTSDEPLKYENVQAQIIEQLRSAYIDKTVAAHTDEIRNRHIDADPEIVASLRTRYGTVMTPAQSQAAATKDVNAPAH